MNNHSNFCNIIILLPFFGKFPWFIDIFLHSCSYNSTITFCIITDNVDEIKNIPNNVLIEHKTLPQIDKHSTKKLGFKTVLTTAYKICDFRPSFGYLFPELIEGFDFWGTGDIDVIYGDLRSFLASELLCNYDVISFRPEYLTGCFTLYRNSEKINNLFKQSKDYRTVLSSNTYYNFDECNFLFAPLQSKESICKIPFEIESMTHVVKRKHQEGYIKTYMDFYLLEGLLGNLKWVDGKIIYRNKLEAALYHFLEFKDKCKKKKVLIKKGRPLFISKSLMYTKKIKNHNRIT